VNDFCAYLSTHVSRWYQVHNILSSCPGPLLFLLSRKGIKHCSKVVALLHRASSWIMEYSARAPTPTQLLLSLILRTNQGKNRGVVEMIRCSREYKENLVVPTGDSTVPEYVCCLSRHIYRTTGWCIVSKGTAVKVKSYREVINYFDKTLDRENRLQNQTATS